MTAKTRAMVALLEGCEGGFAQAGQLLSSAVEAMFADDTDPPVELGAALDALAVAVEALARLDEVTR